MLAELLKFRAYYWKSFEMNKKGWKTAEKKVSTSFWVRAAPKSWSKYTTHLLRYSWLETRLEVVTRVSSIALQTNFANIWIGQNGCHFIQILNGLFRFQMVWFWNGWDQRFICGYAQHSKIVSSGHSDLAWTMDFLSTIQILFE